MEHRIRILVHHRHDIELHNCVFDAGVDGWRIGGGRGEGIDGGFGAAARAEAVVGGASWVEEDSPVAPVVDRFVVVGTTGGTFGGDGCGWVPRGLR